MATSTVYHHRARVAALSRDRSPGDPELEAARSALRAARIEQQIEELTANPPPEFTDAQRDRLAMLLAPTATAGGAA